MTSKEIANILKQEIAKLPVEDLRLLCLVQLCAGSGFKPNDCIENREQADHGIELMMGLARIVTFNEFNRN